MPRDVRPRDPRLLISTAIAPCDSLIYGDERRFFLSGRIASLKRATRVKCMHPIITYTCWVKNSSNGTSQQFFGT